MSPSARAAVAAALGSVFFGGMVFSTRFVIGQTDPITLALLRCGIGALCLAPVLLAGGRWRVHRGDLGGVVGLGIVLYAMMPASIAAGLQFTYASRGALVLASQPFFTLLLGWWRGSERLTGAKLAGIAASAAGLAIALGGPARSEAARLWLGDLLLFFAAICVAIYTVYAQPYLTRYPALVFTALTMTAGALALIPFAVAIALGWGLPAFTPLGLGAVLYIGTFGAAISYSLWVWALARTTPTRVTIFIALNPLTATLLGGTLLSEPITARFVLGFLIVLAGIAVTYRPERAR